MLIEVLISVIFGLNDAEIKKMTKFQDLKNEVKKSWKLKNNKVGAVGMMKKNLTDILKTIPGNIITNYLKLEAVLGLVMILKRALDTKF